MIVLTETLKAKWIAALKSGQFKQGKDRLKNKDKYCCLGVLREVSGYTGRTASGLLTPRHRKRSWSSKSLVDGLPVDQQQTLAEMNDGGYSFSKIADWIEENIQPVKK